MEVPCKIPSITFNCRSNLNANPEIDISVWQSIQTNPRTHAIMFLFGMISSLILISIIYLLGKFCTQTFRERARRRQEEEVEFHPGNVFWEKKKNHTVKISLQAGTKTLQTRNSRVRSPWNWKGSAGLFRAVRALLTARWSFQIPKPKVRGGNRLIKKIRGLTGS